MTTSCSVTNSAQAPVTEYEYPNFSESARLLMEEERRAAESAVDVMRPDAPEGFVSLLEMERKIAEVQRDSLREGELRGLLAAQERIEQERRSIQSAIETFAADVTGYFGRVEADVVNLALGIAAKILHREAQVDRMLVAALVKVAIDELRQETQVKVRVNPGEAEAWAGYFAEGEGQTSTKVSVVSDASLKAGDCVLETELGVAELGIDAQMKEIERGFFDLLAQRPGAR